jgi:hypothetical protein
MQVVQEQAFSHAIGQGFKDKRTHGVTVILLKIWSYRRCVWFRRILATTLQLNTAATAHTPKLTLRLHAVIVKTGEYTLKMKGPKFRIVPHY